MKLKRVERENLPKLMAWRNSYGIMCFCRQHKPISSLDQDAWFIKQNNNPATNMFEIHKDGNLVGVCGLTDIDLLYRRAEFSIYIGPEFQGKGYSREALDLLFDYGFNTLNLNLIWGETFSNNHAQHLFEKIGMKKEGVRRQFYFKDGRYIDCILYSILRDEWLNI